MKLITDLFVNLIIYRIKILEICKLYILLEHYVESRKKTQKYQGSPNSVRV